MSALFFKVSWPHNIEKYRALQTSARKLGLTLVVKNMSRMRGIPVFLFFLDRKDGRQPESFSDLVEIENELTKLAAASHAHAREVL